MADTDRSLKVSDIVELRNYSRDWMNNNFWDELVEVFRGIMCRTAPIMRKNPETGKDEEDKSRTNVAMADLNIIWRRNTARMTANPYRLNFTGGDELIAEMLSGVAR